jgi:hypothetical protein
MQKNPEEIVAHCISFVQALAREGLIAFPPPFAHHSNLSKMKNQFTSAFIVLLILSFSSLKAQLSLGFKAGVNISAVTTDQGYLSGGIQNVFGLHFGTLLEIGLVDHFAVQPELSFLQKGFRNDEKSINWIFNELDLHLLAKYKYNIGKVKGNIVAGPTIGSVMGGYKKPDNGDKITLHLDDDMIKRWDYGITAGLGFGLDVGPGTLVLDGRYLLSLDNIFEEGSPVITGKSRKVGFDYTLGYLFPF